MKFNVKTKRVIIVGIFLLNGIVMTVDAQAGADLAPLTITGFFALMRGDSDE